MTIKPGDTVIQYPLAFKFLLHNDLYNEMIMHAEFCFISYFVHYIYQYYSKVCIYIFDLQGAGVTFPRITGYLAPVALKTLLLFP